MNILVIDQGTTSTRAMVFGPQMGVLAVAQREVPQLYPRPGWVEHDPEALWSTAMLTARAALDRARLGPADVAAIGITNQRETVVVWERSTGRPIAPAIVWQDRRTAEACAALEAAGHGALVAARTGLRLDPYFSATKLAWLLDHVPGARERAVRGELAAGTVDCFLLWRLTEGAVHATDATNASRTALCDIHAGAWHDDLLALFRVPRAVLPEIRDTMGAFGTTRLFGGAVPIRAMAGDQQAALAGQACFAPGMVKATFGTGAFVLLHTGAQAVGSAHRMLTTVAWQRRGVRAYALEGSIFSAGSGVQWLRDGLGLVREAAEVNALAAAADPAQDVYLVPAFTGLGAPYWDSHARATLSGMTRGTTGREVARAVLESVGYQTRDLVAAMLEDAELEDGGLEDGGLDGGLEDAGEDEAGGTAPVLRVDGGMSASDWTMQFLADMLDVRVERPANLETTALGAAYLAGLEAGVYPEPEVFAGRWARERQFVPGMDAAERARKYRGWQDAVGRTLSGGT